MKGRREGYRLARVTEEGGGARKKMGKNKIKNEKEVKKGETREKIQERTKEEGEREGGLENE